MKKLLSCSLLIALMCSVGVGYGSNTAPTAKANTELNINAEKQVKFTEIVTVTELQVYAVNHTTPVQATEITFVAKEAETTLNNMLSKNLLNTKAFYSPPTKQRWFAISNYLSSIKRFIRPKIGLA